MKISKTTQSILLLTCFCLLLVAARIIKTAHLMGLFLVWNLFLAWMPLLVILITRRLYAQHKNTLILWIGVPTWLLFFPNAPYIITDLIHLDELPSKLLWFDSLGIFTYASTGLLIGLYSLKITHQLLSERFNSLQSWLMVFVFSMLSGYGVYLGRYLRFNSWDMFTHPFGILKMAILEIKNPLCMQNTLVFGVAIFSFYVAINIHSSQKNELQKSI